MTMTKNEQENSIWSIKHSHDLIKEHSKVREKKIEIKTIPDKADYFDEYSSIIKEVIEDLNKEKYTSFFQNFVDNIFIFYKFYKEKLYITVLEGDSACIKNKTPFRTKNYSFNIQNLNISSNQSNLGIIIKDNKEDTFINCFHALDPYAKKRDLTTIELTSLNKNKQKLFQKIYFFNKKLIQKQKQLSLHVV